MFDGLDDFRTQKTSKMISLNFVIVRLEVVSERHNEKGN